MLKAVIIDDENAAIESLRILIGKHTPEVAVIAASTVCVEGIRFIEEMHPDIVFLDISMPEMSGFSLLQRLRHKDFHLVFTTAHERYAIQAIKHHATDYLLKPVDIEELKQAIKMIADSEETSLADMAAIQNTRRLDLNSHIGLSIKDGLQYYMVSDIVWIESNGNYSIFHMTSSKKYVMSKNIGEYENSLPEKEFFRVHKSYIINIRKVNKYIHSDGYYVEMTDGAIIEISRRKKDEFLHLMKEIQ